MVDNKIKVLSIAGPTASGKTALSVSLAMQYDGEIVSADSMQIYKGMNIATAKPSLEERCNIPHHLMDFLEVDEIYSVARYINDASFAIKDIFARGKLPILVGGTGLYIDSLLNGLTFTEGEVDLELRKTLMQQLDDKGLDYLLDVLASVDPKSAEKMKLERNPKRIIRALEIFYTTGITMTEQNLRSKSTESIFNPVKIALNFRNREKLYERINLRVDLMLEMGLLKEAEDYFKMNQGDTSKQAIGYKELKPYFDNEKTLDECIETLKRSTRRYAKRQLTWFSRDPDIRWFFVDDYSSSEELLTSVRSYLNTKGFDKNERT
ncbi:MAG: tRNA (adenosine(37)-N6)-dimethylallyltransferase MiaA [Ruminococcaceae bacterium]|nr:tRNA (adenosine(37)-N6)-dimethylallyltransferase MiaA [Oscillospiraceae bacterium]